MHKRIEKRTRRTRQGQCHCRVQGRGGECDKSGCEWLRGKQRDIVRRAKGQSLWMYCLGVVRGGKSERGNDNRGMRRVLCGEQGESLLETVGDIVTRLEAAVKRFLSPNSLCGLSTSLPLHPPPSPLSSSVLLSFFSLSPFSDRVISYQLPHEGPFQPI